MPAQPQDRKPAKGSEFTFHGKDGKKYSLPPATSINLPGSDLMDSVLGGEIGQMEYMFKKLKASGKTDAIDALRSMTEEDMLGVMRDWGEFGDGDGASLGE